MARPRVDAELGALARRRADVASAHFALACTPDAHSSDASTPSPKHQRFAISAPKRQLRRAVDRNALKRVAREAWRLAAWPVGRRPNAAMLKLRRAESDWKTMGRAALKKVWRTEIDELVSRLIRRLGMPPVGLDRRPLPPADAAAAETVLRGHPRPQRP